MDPRTKHIMEHATENAKEVSAFISKAGLTKEERENVSGAVFEAIHDITIGNFNDLSENEFPVAVDALFKFMTIWKNAVDTGVLR